MLEIKTKEKDHLVKIAYWYYKRNMTQSEIAKRLGMTRQRVNQLIGALEDLRIVEIKINGLVDDYAELEHSLEKRFGLHQVSIIDMDEKERDPLGEFGKKAAEIIGTMIEDGQIIGLSWGSTLGETVKFIKNKKCKKGKIVQLVGGINSTSRIVRPDEITRLMASKLGCECNILYAPVFVESSTAKDFIINEASIVETFATIKQCDLALLGVGELTQDATISREGFLPKERLSSLIAQGGIGDIAMLPYTKDGKWLENENLIGIDWKTLEQIPNVVILACGKNKTAAVIGALKTGSVNTLILDSAMAKEIATIEGLS